MSDIAKRQFVRQQGFGDAPAAMCLLLAGILWWNALVAPRNPLDALYNRAIAGPRNLPSLTPAPAPRRFAQGMAGTILGGAGLALLAGWPRLAWILEGLVAAALGALVLGRFCLGSYFYHLLRGEARFANRTLPWSRAE